MAFCTLLLYMLRLPHQLQACLRERLKYVQQKLLVTPVLRNTIRRVFLLEDQA